jgi:membrane protease YdiL (CAAX protease family)
MDSIPAHENTLPTPVWPAPPTPSDDSTNPFIGRFGLRAVWGILLYVLFFVVFTTVLHFAILAGQGKLKSSFASHGQKATATATTPAKSPSAPHPDEKPKNTILNDAPLFGLAALATFLLSRIERRKFGVYGIGRNRLRDFLPGAFWGLALLSALVALLRATHVLVFDGRALTGPAIYAFGTKWLLAFLFVGLFEEYLSRGYIQYALTRGFYTMAERISPTHARSIAFWAAAVLMSCFFGAGHLGNPGESAAGITAVFLAGMVFSYALWHTGSLWWAIGFHMAWDWAQSFLYGVPDSGYLSEGRLFHTHPTGNPLLSGGTAGPEGSVFVLPTLLLVMVVVRFTTRRGEQPDLYPLPKPESLPPESTTVIA